MIVQRSVFGNNRLTLFCNTKYRKDRKRKIRVIQDEELRFL